MTKKTNQSRQNGKQKKERSIVLGLYLSPKLRDEIERLAEASAPPVSISAMGVHLLKIGLAQFKEIKSR